MGKRQTVVSSYNDCTLLCDGTSGCVAFNYATQSCTMFSVVTGTTPQAGAIAGRLIQSPQGNANAGLGLLGTVTSTSGGLLSAVTSAVEVPINSSTVVNPLHLSAVDVGTNSAGSTLWGAGLGAVTSETQLVVPLSSVLPSTSLALALTSLVPGTVLPSITPLPTTLSVPTSLPLSITSGLPIALTTNIPLNITSILGDTALIQTTQIPLDLSSILSGITTLPDLSSLLNITTLLPVSGLLNATSLLDITTDIPLSSILGLNSVVPDVSSLLSGLPLSSILELTTLLDITTVLPLSDGLNLTTLLEITTVLPVSEVFDATTLLGITTDLAPLQSTASDVLDLTTLLPSLSLSILPLPTIVPPAIDLSACPNSFFCPGNVLNGTFCLSPNPYSSTYNVTCE